MDFLVNKSLMTVWYKNNKSICHQSIYQDLVVPLIAPITIAAEDKPFILWQLTLLCQIKFPALTNWNNAVPI